jgi:prepilin-type N-terminal cleavage/methylation domain-containing protein
MKRRAFTLVELLVVIAIVGLLSGVAIVSLNNSRDKAKIAAGQSLDQSIRQALGDQLIGEWLMNECSGNTAADISGSGNTATWSGGASWSTSNAPGGSGCSASFTGSNFLATSLNLQKPSVTFTAWVYPTSTSGYNEIMSKEAQYKYRIHDGALEALMGCTGSGWSHAMYLSNVQVPTNAWSMLALSVDSVNLTTTLYMNGRIVGKIDTCAIASYNANALAIGSYSPVTAAEPFHGNIDEARIYTTALSLSQIEKLYAEGSTKRHLTAAGARTKK